MAEFARCEASVVVCHAEPETLDAVSLPAEAAAGRVAEDELLLIAAAGLRDQLIESARTAQGASPGLVVDDSDGWRVFAILGNEAEGVLAQLSHVVLPAARPAFVQGPIAHVPGKVLATGDTLFVLAPAPAAHHVERRLRDACGPPVPDGNARAIFAARAGEV